MNNVDNRKTPRYRVYLPVMIDGIELIANNISSTGLQVSCPDFLYGRLQDTVERDIFQVDIQVPEAESVCQSSCKVIYHSEFGDEFLIGLEHLDLPGNNQLLLDTYLNNLAANNTPVVE